MGGQVCHDPLINIRNIVGKRTVEHDQVNIEGIDDIINADRHIFYKQIHHLQRICFPILICPEKAVNGNGVLMGARSIFFQNSPLRSIQLNLGGLKTTSKA